MSSVTSVYGELSMSMPDEEPCRLGLLEDAAQVVDAARAVDVEPELRQLQREVAADAGGDDGVDDVAGIRASRRPPASRLGTLSPR